MKRGVWVLALIVSVGNKLAILVLSITAVSLFGCLIHLSAIKQLLKDFSELNPILFPI
jgi:hypothetical protein